MQGSVKEDYVCNPLPADDLQLTTDSTQENGLWRSFIRINLFKSMLINLIFNTCYPYFNIKNPAAVSLFKGESCFARFILPMAFLLPFMITFDMLKKSISVASQGEAGFELPADFSKYRFIFRIAGINGGITLFVILVLMLVLEWCIPETYYFDGRMLSVFMGIAAALLSVVFTLGPIRIIRKMSNQL